MCFEDDFCIDRLAPPKLLSRDSRECSLKRRALTIPTGGIMRTVHSCVDQSLLTQSWLTSWIAPDAFARLPLRSSCQDRLSCKSCFVYTRAHAYLLDKNLASNLDLDWCYLEIYITRLSSCVWLQSLKKDPLNGPTDTRASVQPASGACMCFSEWLTGRLCAASPPPFFHHACCIKWYIA